MTPKQAAFKAIKPLVKLVPLPEPHATIFAHWGNSISDETKEALRKIDMAR